MKTLLLTALLLCALIAGAQTNSTMTATNTPLEIKTKNGKHYRHVSVERVDPDGILINHSIPGAGVGMAKVKFEYLPESLQKEYGYDPKQSADYRAEQAAAQSQLMRNLIASQKSQWDAQRLKDQDNFKGRVELDKLAIEKQRADNEAKDAEARRIQAEADRLRQDTANTIESRKASAVTQNIQVNSTRY